MYFGMDVQKKLADFQKKVSDIAAARRNTIVGLPRTIV
jgi:hypothetical protein